MRIVTRLFIALALVMPLGVLAMEHSAQAATLVKCKNASGTASFSPPFLKAAPNKATWKSEDPKTDAASSFENKPVITTNGATLSNCSGGGVTSATTSSTISFTDPTSCNDLLSLNGEPKPGEVEEPGSNPTGTLTINWNAGGPSTVSVTLAPVPGQTTQTTISGTITSGQFSSHTVSGILSFALNGNGDCVNSDLSGVSFMQAGKFKVK